MLLGITVLFSAFYTPKTEDAFSTDMPTHMYDVLLIHVALQPWMKGTLGNHEQTKSSALKLVSEAIGHRNKKANTWRQVGTSASLVNSDRTDCTGC